MDNGQYDNFDCGLIVGHNVSPDDKPSPATGRHLKACHIRPVRLVIFDSEMGGVALEAGDTPSMPARRVVCKDAALHGCVFVYPVGNLGLL